MLSLVVMAKRIDQAGVCVADLEELRAEVREASDLSEASAGQHCGHVLIWHGPCTRHMCPSTYGLHVPLSIRDLTPAAPPPPPSTLVLPPV